MAKGEIALQMDIVPEEAAYIKIFILAIMQFLLDQQLRYKH